jgi:hypothetical protein
VRRTQAGALEEVASPRPESNPLPAFPAGISTQDVQGQEQGHGPLFHRRYRTQIRDSPMSAEALMALVKSNLNRPAPTSFARFQKVRGLDGAMAVGDEYVVRMPGPWDGPVRVIDVSADAFRFATLERHLEAGQIEFRALAHEPGRLRFEIESWARSGNWFAHLLYHRMRMAKEVQAHMWISFLEGVVTLSGGRMTGGRRDRHASHRGRARWPMRRCSARRRSGAGSASSPTES